MNPPPVPTTSAAVWPSVIARIRRAGGAPRLVAAMVARDAFGRLKYGTPLQADNGRDHLRDQLDEALDGAAYAMAEALTAGQAGDVYAMHRNLRRCDAFAALAADVLDDLDTRERSRLT